MKQIEELENLSKELHIKFNRLIEPHRNDLWKYCILLTRSPWDAEDLLQETLLKAFATLPQLCQPVIPKSYIFRIASNTWIDQYRKDKNKPIIAGNIEEYEVTESISKEEVMDAIQLLVEVMPPRQIVILLLIVVFEFQLSEVASMISTTEGAVKSALHRARANLKKLKNKKNVNIILQTEEDKKDLITAFLNAYNRRDVNALIKMMDENTNEDGAPIYQAYGKKQMEKSTLADWVKVPEKLIAESLVLWDKQVIIIRSFIDNEYKLNSIFELIWEDNKIVKWKDYYFSKELLSLATVTLNYDIDESKNLYGN